MDKTPCSRCGHWMPLGLVAWLSLAANLPATAADGLGAYIGAAIGEGWVKTSDRFFSAPSPGAFSENHSAYKLMAGVRPISLLGAEIAYVDLGHPHQALSIVNFVSSADVRMKGAAAFGILYLPVPAVDIYLKAGLSRIQTSANATVIGPGAALCAINVPNCGRSTSHGSATDTHFAAGAGAQFKLGSWAVRAEYERLDAAGSNPGLATVGVTWTFL
jgi:opacity protein-like surface antigen